MDPRGARKSSRNTKDSWSNNFWGIFAGQSGNCVVAAVFAFVVLISYLLSTVAYKHDQQLNCMKTFLEIMEVEVNRAEKSCMTTAKDVRYLQQYSMRNISTDNIMPVRHSKLRLPLACGPAKE